MASKSKLCTIDPRTFRRPVPSDGPLPCDVLLVGEAPGRNENDMRRPFVGASGDSLNTYLRAADISRNDLHVTNLFPYYTGDGNPKPPWSWVEEEEHRLEEVITKCRPKIIGALGAMAVRWFLGEGQKLEHVHGLPLFSDKAPGAVVVPVYHPAAGFYDPELASYCQDDIFLLGHYLRNPAPPRVAPEISVSRMGSADLDLYGGCVDTEGLIIGILGAKKDRVWGLSWANFSDEAKVWVREEENGRVSKAVPNVRGPIVFHNALHDLKILRALGIDTRKITPHDTMLMAYVLRLEPQALKALAYRHLGLKMKEFDEVVRPHFDRAAIDYLGEAATFDYPKPDKEIEVDSKKRKMHIKQPVGAGRRLKAILKTWLKKRKTEDPVALEDRWEMIPADQRTQIESKMGAPFPEFSLFVVPGDEAVQYSGIDAAATAAIHPILSRTLHAKGLWPVYDMDRRALRYVDRMQETGMLIDKAKLSLLDIDLERQVDKARDTIREVVGDDWFNPGSSDQVARFLYTRKGLQPLRYTESGQGSTSDEALQMLKGYHAKDDPELMEFITSVQDYREADKYRGTFIAPIFDYARQHDHEQGWWLHPNFRVTRVLSGRLSSHEPNVLAFPTRTKLGKRIRECVVAPEGYVVLSADMSQIELRTMAHHCGDHMMRECFELKIDLHTRTAAQIFKKAESEIDKEGAERYVAKTLNFAIMYGISARALLEQFYSAGIFDYTLEDCERFIREWFRIFGSVRRFLELLWKQAEIDGYVKDMWGRICYVPNLRLRKAQLREAAQRLAGNFKIQAGASGLTKRAEIRLIEWVDDEGLGDDVRPFLQVHDELDMYVRTKMAATVKGILLNFMTADQDRFNVPIAASAKIGDSWATAK